MNKVLIFGGAGFATTIGQAIIHANANGYNKYKFAGYINDDKSVDQIEGFPVMGNSDDIPILLEKGYFFIYTILKIGSMPERIKKFNDLNIPSERLATFVHPLSFISPTAKLEPGNVIMPLASVNANTKVGRGTLVFSGSYIGHDCDIGQHNIIAANSCIGSWNYTGKGVWISFNSTIRGRTILNDYSALGAGSVLTKNLPKNELWIGNPAKFHKYVDDKINF
ncbi:MAG: hypothetical protein ACLFVR_09805 [Thiohalospira sp.]